MIERHFKLGGFNHAFTRKGFHWDVGLHYVGEMGAGMPLRRVMDLATGGAVAWRQLPPGYDQFHYPGYSFEAPSDPREYAARLTQAFPDETLAIERYFADVRRATRWMIAEITAWNLPAPLARATRLATRRARDLSLMTLADYLETNVADPRLRAVLASQWGDYALPPRFASFAQHAMIVDHYRHGAWHPVGGSDAMTSAWWRSSATAAARRESAAPPKRF